MSVKSIIKDSLFLGAFLLHHNHDSKVIYYHDAGTRFTEMGTDIVLMHRHFDIIRRSGYNILPTINKTIDEVMICFDDGWAGIYYDKDFFISHNVYPTVFIAVGLIGKKGYLTIEQIKELESIGFRFEAHTWSHRPLTLLADYELKHELKDSKEELEMLFGHPFNSICYPQGRFSKHIHDLCKRYGYERQFSSLHGGYYDLKDKDVICRVCAQFSSPTELKWMLNGTSRLFRNRLMKQHVKGSL